LATTAKTQAATGLATARLGYNQLGKVSYASLRFVIGDFRLGKLEIENTFRITTPDDSRLFLRCIEHHNLKWETSDIE